MQLRRHAAGVPVMLLLALLIRPPTTPAQGTQLSSDVLVYGDTDSVRIVSPQVGIRHAWDEDGSELSARAVIDAISAASVDVVSHATRRFEEIRTEANFALRLALGHAAPSVSFRTSVEPDYMSHGGRVGLTLELGSSDSVLDVGYGLTHDVVTRVGTPRSAFSARLTSHAADVSFTQVLSPRMLVRAVYAVTLQHGFMEKPYRHVPVFSEAALNQARLGGVPLTASTFDDLRLGARPPEEVPDLRHRHALGLRLLRYVPDARVALRLDVQLYADGWGVLAQLAEPGLDVELGERFDLAAFARLYHQGGASFWRRAYVAPGPNALPRFRSLDRDLSAYTTVSGGLRLTWRGRRVETYLEGTARHTRYHDFLLLNRLTAVVGIGGLRVNL